MGYYYADVPSDFREIDQIPDDVSILIGENGSGKSTLLNRLSAYYLSRNKSVVAIANSIYDKFGSASPRFSVLRGRSGRRQSRNLMKNVLQMFSETGNLQKLKDISQILGYVGFSPVIGFRLERINANYHHLLRKMNLSDSDYYHIRYLIDSTVRLSEQSAQFHELLETTEGQRRRKNEYFSSDVIWVEVNSFDFYELRMSALFELYLWESRLKEFGIIDRIEVYLKKGGTQISLFNASSGELSLITSIIHISTVIDDNTVILIDEPENSLHPKWQKEYVREILSIFYLYQPKIIVATHSPMLVNGAETFVRSARVFKAEKFTFKLQQKEAINIEELFFRLFDVTTPQNHFISEYIVRLFNVLANEKVSLDEFEKKIKKIKEIGYEEKQKKMLDSVLEIGREIVARNFKNGK